ncbi:DUF4209 [Desulfonema limicola]|uniref:DUF4209 n=1 Tax=Desulfonema limicola TaxID=45656 RepID=A0A975BDF2_9BACT|nr:DUF4209 domain-containing protein [Desulfonema limicola]QTA83139.1 DUF4209 [Desulfonema limicola]
MEQNDTILKTEDFDQINFDDIFENADKRECMYYRSIFFQKAKENEGVGNSKFHLAFNLLSVITGLHLDIDSVIHPFKPKELIDSISEDQFELLSDLSSKINDPELRARIADIIWIVKKDYRFSELAIKSYLESATNLEDPDFWPPCADRISRAVQLCRQLGKKNKCFSDVFQHIEEVLKRCNGEDPKFLSHRMMTLLLDNKQGDPSIYSNLSEKLAIGAENRKDFFIAKDYWDISARWFARSNNQEKQKAAQINAAETFIKEAEESIANENPSYMKASWFLQRSIDAYRTIGGMQEKVKEIQAKLIEYQSKSVDEMKVISTELDLSEVTEKCISMVKGKKLLDALVNLSIIQPPPTVDKVSKQAEKNLNTSLVELLAASVVVNEKGMVTARKASMHSDEQDEKELAIRQEMHRYADINRSLIVSAAILPAIEEIKKEHNIREYDFISLLTNNPFVPKGREFIFAKGLHAGFSGDFLISTHLLIPQVENSIRYVLQQAGKITSMIDSSGIQDEYLLHKIIYEPEMKDVFGKDITFDLQGLLVDRFGSNLRNLMAHGLMSHDSFYSHAPIYFWWLTLRFCILSILKKKDDEGTENTSSEET